MASVRSAKKQLDKALDRLESAVGRLLGKGGGGGGDEAEIEALRREREDLDSSLAELRQKYDALKQVTEGVSIRLDTTIDSLRNVIRG